MYVLIWMTFKEDRNQIKGLEISAQALAEDEAR